MSTAAIRFLAIAVAGFGVCRVIGSTEAFTIWLIITGFQLAVERRPNRPIPTTKGTNGK